MQFKEDGLRGLRHVLLRLRGGGHAGDPSRRRPPGGDEPQPAGRLQLAPRPLEGPRREADPAEFMSASLRPPGIYALTPKLITVAVDPAPPTPQGGHR